MLTIISGNYLKYHEDLWGLNRLDWLRLVVYTLHIYIYISQILVGIGLGWKVARDCQNNITNNSVNTLTSRLNNVVMCKILCWSLCDLNGTDNSASSSLRSWVLELSYDFYSVNSFLPLKLLRFTLTVSYQRRYCYYLYYSEFHFDNFILSN